MNPKREHAQKLMQLHRLLAEGKGETEEHEALCESMLESWNQLDAPTRELFRQLSADLDMLESADLRFWLECELVLRVEHEECACRGSTRCAGGVRRARGVHRRRAATRTLHREDSFVSQLLLQGGSWRGLPRVL
jgi:hypothetical protein